jgi:hypothetical protein
MFTPETEVRSVVQRALEAGGVKLAPRRISTLIKTNPLDYGWKKPEMLKDIELTLTKWEFQTGPFGEFAVLSVVNEATGELHDVAYGGRILRQQLAALNPSTDVPCSFHFAQEKKTWYMA